MKRKFKMYKNLTKDKERKLIKLYNEAIVSSKEIKVESLKETLLKDSEIFSNLSDYIYAAKVYLDSNILNFNISVIALIISIASIALYFLGDVEPNCIVAVGCVVSIPLSACLSIRLHIRTVKISQLLHIMEEIKDEIEICWICKRF